MRLHTHTHTNATHQVHTLLHILVGYKQLIEWVLHCLPEPPQWTMSPSREELKHLLVPIQGVGGLGTIQHECRVEKALDESDVALFFEEDGHFSATNDITEDGRGNLYKGHKIKKKKKVYGYLVGLS